MFLHLIIIPDICCMSLKFFFHWRKKEPFHMALFAQVLSLWFESFIKELDPVFLLKGEMLVMISLSVPILYTMSSLFCFCIFMLKQALDVEQRPYWTTIQPACITQLTNACVFLYVCVLLFPLGLYPLNMACEQQCFHFFSLFLVLVPQSIEK